jgi:DNA replication protein DnaC
MNTIGGFCFGEHYKDAHMAKIKQENSIAEKMLNWMINPFNIMYFCGNVGNGKTYFAASWYNLLRETKKNVRVFTDQTFFSHLMTCMSNGTDPLWELSRICECDYFILDDLGSCKLSDWKAEILLEFINLRGSNNKPTLITSNLTKEDMRKEHHPRLVSRLFSTKNAYLEVNGPDRRLCDYE